MSTARRFGGPGIRRGLRVPPRVGGSSAPPSPLVIGSPTVYLRQDGITEVSGQVAAQDDEGAAGLRFEPPNVGDRPHLVTVGALQGVQTTTTGLYLRSTTAIQVAEPYIVSLVWRTDTWVANDRLVDIDSASFLATYSNGGTQTLRWEQGASDLLGTTAIANGEVHHAVVKVATTGGTSRLLLDGTELATSAGTAAAPASRAIGIGARNDGAGPASATFLDVSIEEFASNAAMDAYDLAALHAWGAHVISQAGG